MDVLENNSERFWAFMLPVTTFLAIIGSVVAERAATRGELLFQSKLMQSAVLVSLFMGCFSILGLRAVITRAVETRQSGIVKFVSGATMIVCVGYIAYGIYSV